MIKKFVKFYAVILLSSVLLTACSTTSGYKGIYEKTVDERPLETPPDLTQPSVEGNIQLPQLASQQASAAQSGNQVAPLTFGNAQLVREGSMRWLRVAMPIDEVWSQAGLFFKGLGFKIVRQDMTQGVMQTNWLENRTSLPTNWFSKLLNKLYDSGLQDSYRIRVERSSDKQHTLVFITQYGLKEVYEEEGEQHLANTRGWEPRQPDPELESEMLERFAIYLGGNKTEIHQQAEALKKAPALASLVETQDKTRIEINEGFARAWRRIGLALDRLGVEVADRDRSKGNYYVRFPERMLKEEKGLFGDIFSSKEKISPVQYILHLDENADKTSVMVVDQNGQPLTSKEVHLILQQIKSHLI